MDSLRSPFSWHASNGWLVLSGAPDPLSEIRARALSRNNAVGAIAYISLAADMGDALMEDMADLGAPTGYLVDLEEQDNNEIYERLTAAGMIVIEADCAGSRLLRLMTATPMHAIKDALSRGAVILFEGAAATIVGERIVTPASQIEKGLNLLSNAMVLPDTNDVDSQAMRDLHRQLPDTAMIFLERDAALVLGPDQHIETWGEGQVTIRLSHPGDRAQNFQTRLVLK